MNKKIFKSIITVIFDIIIKKNRMQERTTNKND